MVLTGKVTITTSFNLVKTAMCLLENSKNRLHNKKTLNFKVLDKLFKSEIVNLT